MTDIFFLHHDRPASEFEVQGEHDKLLGIYESPDRAEQAIEEYRKLPGFCDHPDGFRIVKGKLDQEIWTPEQIPQKRS